MKKKSSSSVVFVLVVFCSAPELNLPALNFTLMNININNFTKALPQPSGSSLTAVQKVTGLRCRSIYS